MSRCPKFPFQVSIMSKWLALHKLRSKLLLGKDMITLTLVDLEMKAVFLFGNLRRWTFKNNIFASFQLVTRLNSQKRNETILLMNSNTLICIWILAFPIGIIQVSTTRKWSFLLYFSSFHDYWTPTTLISLVHNSLGEMEWCEKHAFQLLKMRKMNVICNIKTKCVTYFLLTVMSSSMKDYTCHYVEST